MDVVSDRAAVSILSTGGTIEKTYNEQNGELANFDSQVSAMLGRLRLPGLSVAHREVIAKDSLHLTLEEREQIVDAILKEADGAAVVVLHGTDTMAETGRVLCARNAMPSHPVVMTGAMRPFGFENSDALQNLTEAVGAARRLRGGFWLAFHGRLLPLPDIRKDREAGCFVEE